MATELLQILPVDIVSNVILSFLSMNDLICFGLTNKNYDGMVNELYCYHIKQRIIRHSNTFPVEVDTMLNGQQLWSLYKVFDKLSFNNNDKNYWFYVKLESNETHIINPLSWHIVNTETNRKMALFKYSQSSYYTGVGLYHNLQFRVGALSKNQCFGKINLSQIPQTIDTFVINMDHQNNVCYYFGHHHIDINNNDQYHQEKKEDFDDLKNENDKIYLWKNILIGGGKFIDDTLDCYDTQKYIKIIDEKLIDGFDEVIYKMNYKCLHLGFYKNQLKKIKNIDKLHPFIANLEITNQLQWSQSLKNINLSNYQRLTKINLSGNDLNGNINDLTQCLPKSLQVLNMNNNENINGCLDFKLLFHDNDLKCIQEIIITNSNLNGIKNFNEYLPNKLKVLCLNYNNICIDWNEEFKIKNEKLRRESCLERLSLCNNKINGYIDFKEMNEWMPYNLYLIDLNNNNLNGIINLNDFPVGLEEFDISDNNIQQYIGLDLIQQNAEKFAGFTYDLDVQYGDNDEL